MPMLDLWPGKLIETTPFDYEMNRLADRHYPDRKPGAWQCAGNGAKIVLRDAGGLVLWVWLWEAQKRWDGQEGYYCQRFRNESDRLSSEIILEAEQVAIRRWGLGRMFTYVDPASVQSTNPGYCYLKAGWHSHGYSKKRKRRILVKYDGC